MRHIGLEELQKSIEVIIEGRVGEVEHEGHRYIVENILFVVFAIFA